MKEKAYVIRFSFPENAGAYYPGMEDNLERIADVMRAAENMITDDLQGDNIAVEITDVAVAPAQPAAPYVPDRFWNIPREAGDTPDSWRNQPTCKGDGQ